MKKIILGSLILAFFSCEKGIEKTKESTLIRDCTGTYLRVDNKDYLICNAELVSYLPNNTKIEASYVTEKDCDKSKDQIICAMYHAHEKIITITKIK